MSIILRVLLIMASAGMISAVILKVRKSKFQIHDGLFWFLLSLFFLILSIFPQIAIQISAKIGVESPANLVFLGILALLLIKNFFMSLKISLLEYNLMELTQRVMIEDKNGTDETPGKEQEQ